MQSLDSLSRCAECSTPLVDDGDEFVCPGCGIATEKMIVEDPPSGRQAGSDFSPQPLGSFLGSSTPSASERHSVGFSKANSTFRYLKMISDYGGREGSSVYTCTKMIERVSDTLGLSKAVSSQAEVVARKILATVDRDRRITLATVSAFSIITSCRMAGVSSVSSREVLRAHAELGRSVKSSSIMRLALESPYKSQPRRPEDYLSRTIARLGDNPELRDELERSGIPQAVYFNSLRIKAVEVLGRLEEDLKEGHRPCALAATAVYSAEQVLSHRDSRPRLVTQRDVSVCGDSAEYTVREQYRQIFMPAVERLKAEARPASAPTAPQ